MKNNVIRMVLALGAACVGGSALQAQSYEMSAKVPFAFQVADKTFEAGKYLVTTTGYSVTPTLKSAKTGRGIFLTGDDLAQNRNGSAKLVFHCYGTENCFLAEVWPETGRASAVTVTKAEKELRNSPQSHEMASISVGLRRAD
jgi:hypothetical protein